MKEEKIELLDDKIKLKDERIELLRETIKLKDGNLQERGEKIKLKDVRIELLFIFNFIFSLRSCINESKQLS